MSAIEHHALDFRNAVDLLAAPEVEKKPLLPIFEAIHNSIQSVQQAERVNGKINVKIIRNSKDMEPHLVEEIVIIDNGIGFTEENLLSFGKLFTSYKKNQFNCKGIGRLSYFAPFFEVNIDSVYSHNNKKFKINLSVTEKNFYEIPKTMSIEVNDEPISTTITLKRLNPKYASLYKLSNEQIKREISQHFLPSLLSIKNIKIFIDDDGEYSIDSGIENVFQDEPIIISDEKFELFHLKNKSHNRSNHKITLSADGRSVKEKKIDFLPNGKIGTDDEKYYLNTIVISDYLNSKLNPQRSGFSIPQADLMDKQAITLDIIYSKVTDSIRQYTKDSVETLEGILEDLIKKTFEELPHLSFLKDDNNIKNSFKLGDDENAVKDAYIREFALKQVESFNYVKLISKKYEANDIPNFEDFQKESLNKLEAGMKLNHAPLVSYIKYRDYVLDLYGKLLEQKPDKKYQPEHVLHSLLFPTKTDSKDYEADYFKHNLWIIDDRYAIYNFLTSDLPESETTGSEFDRHDKRYDICAAYSDPIGEEHNVFIIELKKTNLPLSERNDPIAQIKNYVQRMIKRKASRHNGTRLNITDSTQFFGLVLCDVHNDYFQDYMISGHSLKKRPDSKSYHAVLLNERFFLEITNYENLLDIARARNRVFFDKLNYNHSS